MHLGRRPLEEEGVAAEVIRMGVAVQDRDQLPPQGLCPPQEAAAGVRREAGVQGHAGPSLPEEEHVHGARQQEHAVREGDGLAGHGARYASTAAGFREKRFM